MSDTMKLTLQLTAVEMLSGVFKRAEQHIKSLGTAGKDVKRDFDDMTAHITRGLQLISVSAYGAKKVMDGIRPAADLQEAMLKVESNLGSGVANAKELTDQLKQVKRTAIEISANAPFSAEEVVLIENALLKAGLSLKDVSGKAGAAWAATALASLTGEAPAMVGDSLARIGSQFQLKGGQYGDLADWIVRVDDVSATSVPELIYGLRMAGSNAKALGISAKDSITTLGALAPLGERAGSSFNNMLIGMIGMSKQQRQLMHTYGLNFFDKGKFVGMDAATKQMKERFSSITDDQKRLVILMKIFGEEGGRAANTLIDADKGFRDIQNSAGKAYSIQQKMGVWDKGFNASIKKLGGTTRTTIATLFDPMLGTLTKISDLLNKIVGKGGELAEEHKGVTGTGAALLSAGIGMAAGYGFYRLGKGGMAGRRVLTGLGGVGGFLRGFGSLGAGVAKGKALQEAAGVTPVFVTNWPGDLGGGIAAGTAADMAAGAGMGKVASMGLRGGSVLAAGAAGYGIGSWLESNFIKGWWGDKLYDLLHSSDRQAKNDIKIELTVDGAGRTFSNVNGSNTRVETLPRGSFFGAQKSH